MMQTDLKVIIDDEALQRDIGFVGSVIICRASGIKIYKGGCDDDDAVCRRVVRRLNRNPNLYAINTDEFITIFHPIDSDVDELLPTITEEIENANTKHGINQGEITIYKQKEDATC